METIKKLFPFAFTAKANLTALIINVLIHIVVGAVIGFVLGLLSGIPVVGILVTAVSSVIGLYMTVSMVLSILDYLKVIK